MPESRCPRCGASHGDDLGENAFGELVTLCGACGSQYETVQVGRKENRKIVVDYFIIECPHCGSDDHYVDGTQRPIRYHKCRSCNKSFQSCEKRVKAIP